MYGAAVGMANCWLLLRNQPVGFYMDQRALMGTSTGVTGSLEVKCPLATNFAAPPIGYMGSSWVKSVLNLCRQSRRSQPAQFLGNPRDLTGLLWVVSGSVNDKHNFCHFRHRKSVTTAETRLKLCRLSADVNSAAH